MTEAPPAVATRAAQVATSGRGRTRPWAAGVAVPGVFLAVAVAIWWQVWSGRPTAAMTCGCGDPSLFVWSFGWVAHALTHAGDPFLSSAMFHPGGINLLANTSGLLAAFVLTPVTWAFGPVAALNVADTLAPALSGWATYWAVRHCGRTRHLPALAAGLIVELSPAVVGSVAVSHLQIGLLAFVPVVGVCLHELLVVQGGSRWRWGALLGAALVGQFFAGTELFVIMVLFAAVVIAARLAALGWAFRQAGAVSGTLRYAAQGLSGAVAITAVALAGPAWFALAGPRHFSGAPWSEATTGAGTSLGSLVSAPHSPVAGFLYRISGYEGAVGAPTGFLGWGVVIAALLAAVRLRRLRLAWALSAVALTAGLCALGARHRPPGVPLLPWAALGRLPVLRDILAANISVLVVVPLAVLIGLGLDRLPRVGPGRMRFAPMLVATGLVAGALAPLATAWALPLTAAPLALPAWFVRDAPRLPPGSVVLAYPFAGPPGEGEAAVWQSVDRMHFAIAGGFGLVPGPDGSVDHGITPGSASEILSTLSLPLAGALPALTDERTLETVRSALAAWRVTTVVVTDLGRDPGYAAQWFGVLLGRPPQVEDGSSVWTVG